MIQINHSLTKSRNLPIVDNTSEHYWRNAIIAGLTEFLPNGDRPKCYSGHRKRDGKVNEAEAAS